MQQISERILLTLWVGGMWIVGPVVTPTLFRMLDDRVLAGTVAGQLFTIMSFIGLFCGGMLLLSHAWSCGRSVFKSWRAWLLLVMLIVIIIGEFVISPEIVAIRDVGMQDEARARFDLLHRTASTLYMMSSLAGLVLVIFGLDSRNRQAAI
jgi:MFS family permease